MIDKRAHSSWLPSRSELVDIAFIVALALLGLVGLGTVYGGRTYLLVGALGVGVGLVIAHLGLRLHAPWYVLSIAVVFCYFALAGAVALRGDRGGAVPDVQTIRTLTDVVLNGWRQLLSVAPPVGTAGPLLALPYLLGLAVAVVVYTLARRVRAAWAPLIPLTAVLAASILLGGLQPYSVVLQGLVYFCVSGLYLTVRSRRRTQLTSQRRRPARFVGAAALLTVAGLVGYVVSPAMAFAGTEDRVVLRESVVPPFDPHDWVSPLAQLRHWQLPKAQQGQSDETLFTVSPAAPVSVRIATMDAYDGVVYNVAGDADAPRPGIDATSSGWFQPVGTTLPDAVAENGQPTSTFSVTVGSYAGIWMPTIGEPTTLSFDGDSADLLSKSLRFNSATNSAIAATSSQPNSGGLSAGESYTMTSVLRPTDQAGTSGIVPPSVTNVSSIANAGSLAASVPAPTGPPLSNLPDLLATASGDATGAFARSKAIATYLSGQSLDNGSTSSQSNGPGHSVRRLQDMTAVKPWAGNAEQFSALMALLLTSDSQDTIPARVVVGVRELPANGIVKGKDITAWVEVGIDGYGWVPFFPTPTTPIVKKRNTSVSNRSPNDPPLPPGSPHLRSALVGSDNADSDKKTAAPDPAGRAFPTAVIIAGTIVGVPVLLVGTLVLLVLLLKRRRRRRRREAANPAFSVAGGWEEVVDWARDVGREVPTSRTRRETAESLDIAAPAALLGPLAHAADRAVFAPDPPTFVDVEGYWADVDSARGRLVGDLPRWRRKWARINPASLRRHDGKFRS